VVPPISHFPLKVSGWGVLMGQSSCGPNLVSSYDPSKELNILTDGANSAGIVFMPYQNLNDEEPGKEDTIVAVNSSGLKVSQLGFSPVDCDVLQPKISSHSSDKECHS